MKLNAVAYTRFNHFPTQLGLPFYGKELDVDGVIDAQSKGCVQYIGKATHVFDNTWRCLANVEGALCVVEVRITFAKSGE